MKLLIINPGATSTKIAVFEDEEQLFKVTIDHSAEELDRFPRVIDQADYRKEAILKAITEAEAYHGPSLIIGYSPCEMHSIKGGMMNCQKEMKKAVECGYWNLFRFNPAADKKFTLDSKAPAGGYREFLMNEARYSRLTREFPERAEGLFTRNEDAAKERYEHLTKLIDLYDKQ